VLICKAQSPTGMQSGTRRQALRTAKRPLAARKKMLNLTTSWHFVFYQNRVCRP